MTAAIANEPCTLTASEIRAKLAAHRRVRLDMLEFRRASVLVPLMEIDGQWELVLTRRNNDLPHHQGQIAFPGGSIDLGETVEAAALREAWEEIDLDSESVDVLGCHDDIWTPSGFIITPVVGIIAGGTRFKPNPAEVARLFSVPLCFFAQEQNTERRSIVFEGKEREVFFYTWDGESIWGATALMIRNLLAFLQGEDREKVGGDREKGRR